MALIWQTERVSVNVAQSVLSFSLCAKSRHAPTGLRRVLGTLTISWGDVQSWQAPSWAGLLPFPLR